MKHWQYNKKNNRSRGLVQQAHRGRRPSEPCFLRSPELRMGVEVWELCPTKHSQVPAPIPGREKARQVSESAPAVRSLRRADVAPMEDVGEGAVPLVLDHSSSRTKELSRRRAERTTSRRHRMQPGPPRTSTTLRTCTTRWAKCKVHMHRMRTRALCLCTTQTCRRG